MYANALSRSERLTRFIVRIRSTSPEPITKLRPVISATPQAEGMTVKPGFGAHQIRHHRHSDFLFVGSTHPRWPPFAMLFELPQSQVERVRSNRCGSILEPMHPNDAATCCTPLGWPWRLTAARPDRHVWAACVATPVRFLTGPLCPDASSNGDSGVQHTVFDREDRQCCPDRSQRREIRAEPGMQSGTRPLSRASAALHTYPGASKPLPKQGSQRWSLRWS